MHGLSIINLKVDYNIRSLEHSASINLGLQSAAGEIENKSEPHFILYSTMRKLKL